MLFASVHEPTQSFTTNQSFRREFGAGSVEKVVQAYNTVLLECENLGGKMGEEGAREFFRFMSIMANEQPKLHSSFAPSLLLDKIWHSIMLTGAYGDLCANIINGGCQFNHSVVFPNPISREVRAVNTLGAYIARFHNAPPPWIWDDTFQYSKLVYEGANSPAVQIFVNGLTGATETLVVRLDWTPAHLLYIYMMQGYAWQDVRLVFSGQQLEAGKTLAEYGVRSLSTLHMMLRLRGC